jgi:hypothetical protein
MQSVELRSKRRGVGCRGSVDARVSGFEPERAKTPCGKRRDRDTHGAPAHRKLISMRVGPARPAYRSGGARPLVSIPVRLRLNRARGALQCLLRP